MNMPKRFSIVFLMCIQVFKVNCILNEMSLLECFHDMCAYDLILSTSGVLTPFLPFPQHFRFRLSKDFWRRHVTRIGFLNHPSRVGPHFPRAMHY